MDKPTYDDLCGRVAGEEIDCWYIKTQDIFRGHKLKSEADLIRLVAFAYSWMPTVPKWSCELDWSACSDALLRLKKNEKGALAKLFGLIVPSVNNSIVGASKALHFAYPDSVPIIDSNVVIGWRAIFFPAGLRGKGSAEIAALPSDFGAYGNDTTKRTKHICLYARYAENLSEWTGSLPNVSIRDIESKFYLLGRKISAKLRKKKKLDD